MTAISQITERDVAAMQIEATFRSNGLDLYQDISSRVAVYPGRGTTFGLLYVALRLASEAGAISEKVGEGIRDGGLVAGMRRPQGEDLQVAFGTLTSARRAAILLGLGDVLWCIAAAAGELGVPLSEIAVGNLEKLESRSARDTLQGSGDSR